MVYLHGRGHSRPSAAVREDLLSTLARMVGGSKSTQLATTLFVLCCAAKA